ncbi:MAG: serpin family protein [Bacteroidales bacterium]|nr:serpin family protein [Bacteroidales bacterium]
MGFTCLYLFLLLPFIAAENTIHHPISTSGLTPLISTGVQDSLIIDSINQPQQKPDTTRRFIFDHSQGSDTITSIGQLYPLQRRVAGIIRVDYPQENDTTDSVQETGLNQVPQANPKESKEYLKNASSLNNYSFDLYHKLRHEEENILLSPLSSYYALLLAYEGAEGQTKEEFEKVLHIREISRKTMNSLLLPLSDTLQGYHISNAIWTDNDMVLKKKYKQAITCIYSSEIKQTNFQNKEVATSAINGWISQKTNDKIREVVNSSDIADSTSLVIVNSLYLKGEWRNKFDKERTNPAPFFVDAENQSNVDFMNATETLPYFENESYQFISKPFKDSSLSFCVVLPKALFGIDALEEKINVEFLKETLDSASPAQTNISIPKLRLETAWRIEDALQQMGLKAAFSNQSDFSGITDMPLSLGKVIHKAVIELDEEKAEAAAATTGTFYIRGLPSYHIFKADHPFLFFVIDNHSKTIFFMGRYNKPSDGEAIEKEALASNLKKRETEEFFFGNKPQKILFIIDEKIESQDTFNSLNHNDIKSFKIIKETAEIRKYTTEDYNHAIIITLKKNDDGIN